MKNRDKKLILSDEERLEKLEKKVKHLDRHQLLLYLVVGIIGGLVIGIALTINYCS
jgi:formate/nitrite transporter FocA (FNT family)